MLLGDHSLTETSAFCRAGHSDARQITSRHARAKLSSLKTHAKVLLAYLIIHDLIYSAIIAYPLYELRIKSQIT